MLVASCSVLPSRVNNEKFRQSVEMLCTLDKISNIYIQYPKTCVRLKLDYPEPPNWMKNNPKIIINSTKDVGPLTKVAPLLDIIPRSYDCGIVLFDDDILYDINWWKDLISSFEKHQRLSAVGKHGSLHRYIPYCYNQFNTKYEDEPYLVLKTSFGVIYPRFALPDSCSDALEKTSKYLQYGSYNNDDIMLSSWCYTSGTVLYVNSSSPESIASFKSNNSINDDVSLCKIKSHEVAQVKLASKMMQEGDWPVPWSDITTSASLILLTIILLVFSHTSF